MCGIIGIVGSGSVSPMLLNSIQRLEYRGYDSVGMATLDSGTFHVKKDVGEVAVVQKKVDFSTLLGSFGMAHTRWATNGGVTSVNAHPHLSQDKRVVVVHNGIIENADVLKKKLQEAGYHFVSETDSELIPHYIEQKLKGGRLVNEAICDFIKDAQGTFAILLMVVGDNKLYAIRRDSPLVLGVGDGSYYVGSDIYAFSDKTNKAIFFDNDEFARVDVDGYTFFDSVGREVVKEVKEFVWEEKEGNKQEYEHFMMKEIMEEPAVVKRLLLSLDTDQKLVFGQLVDMIKNSRKVVFVAAGTSYHATLLGAYYLHSCGVEAQTLIASEFEHFALLDENSLVIALSQSGETMDVIDALKYAKAKGAKIAVLVNVPYSTVQRMADLSLQVLAGQEICVAATKSFVNQVTLLLKVAQAFGFEVNLEKLPDRITSVFELIPEIKALAKEVYEKNDLYVLGRGLSYPVAREIALKIKEISYIHAEGMMGGELKHGTIALIEDGTPVISLVSNGDSAMLSNAKEVEARGARVITITNGQHDGINVPTSNDGKFGILASIVGQLLAYYVALERGLPIDKPRNLAKSVTVR